MYDICLLRNELVVMQSFPTRDILEGAFLSIKPSKGKAIFPSWNNSYIGDAAANTIDNFGVLIFPMKNEFFAARVDSTNEKNDGRQGKASAAHVRVQAGIGTVGQGAQRMAAVAATLGVVEQTLCNWVKV
jgi:hypothetical protein